MDFDFDVLEEVEKKHSVASTNGSKERATTPTKRSSSGSLKSPPRSPGSYVNGEVWEVIGGVDRGGIVVRRGAQLVSPELPKRLSTGALVKKLEVEGDRMKYQRLSGDGPDTGWVSIRSKGKDIMVKTSKRPGMDVEKVAKSPSAPKVIQVAKAEAAKEQAKTLATPAAPPKAAEAPKAAEPPKAPAPEPPQPKAPEPAKVEAKAIKPPAEEPAKPAEALPSNALPSNEPQVLTPVAEEKASGGGMNLVLIAGGLAIVAAVVAISMTKLKKK